jgi:hypothetical protein
MKIILTLAAAAIALCTFATPADAGYYKKIRCGYDSCGRPVYRCVYVRTYSDYCAPSYRSYNHHSSHHHYSAPRYPSRDSSYKPGHSRHYGYNYGYGPSYRH